MSSELGFWTWFWIWAGLATGSLILLIVLAKSLFNKIGDAGHQVARMLNQAAKLVAALENKPLVSAPESSILADPVALTAKRRALQKSKIKKQERRQRRLIASLKRFNPNESRFH